MGATPSSPPESSGRCAVVSFVYASSERDNTVRGCALCLRDRDDDDSFKTRSVPLGRLSSSYAARWQCVVESMRMALDLGYDNVQLEISSAVVFNQVRTLCHHSASSCGRPSPRWAVGQLLSSACHAKPAHS